MARRTRLVIKFKEPRQLVRLIPLENYKTVLSLVDRRMHSLRNRMEYKPLFRLTLAVEKLKVSKL